MKLIDMVEELVSQGHKITFRHRTDGGIIITSIDGKKFSSLTEGNKTARSMVVGGELSMARAEQVKFNVNKYIKLKKGEHKAKGKIEDVLDKQLKQTQKVWRENNIQAGKISKKKLRWYIKNKGRDRAMEYLESRERYAKGIAVDENVKFLIERTKRLYNVDNRSEKPKYTREIDALVEDMEQLRMQYQFKEAWIEPIYKELGVSEGVNLTQEDIPQIIRNIRSIINMPE